VARLDSFDITACPVTWFDVDLDQNGWWDRDLVDCRITPPPPPPPPPTPRPSRRSITRRGVRGGGGGGITRVARYCPPEWLLRITQPEECKPTEETDYALIHVTEGAVVRAMAAGVIESFVDEKGRSSVVLTTDDGTRYWYADIGAGTVANGERVEAGQPIARTKAGAPPIPTITATSSRALPEHNAPPTKPAQVVFVETPLPPPPPLRRFVLIPIHPPLPKEWAGVTPPARQPAPVIVRAVASIGAVAVAIYVLSRLAQPPRRPPPKHRKRSRKQPRRRKR
jgi:hypothetical protein